MTTAVVTTNRPTIPSADEKLFLDAGVLEKSLSNRIRRYQEIVQETGGLRKQIKKVDEALKANGICLEDIKTDPNYGDAYQIQTLMREKRAASLKDLANISENIADDLRTIIKGMEFVRILDVATPFLSKEEQQKATNIESMLSFIKENRIFLYHGITSWPKELAPRKVQTMLADYNDLIDKARFTVENPPAAPVAVPEIKLKNTVAQDRGLRKEALIDAHIPDSLKEDRRLLELSGKTLGRRINSILKHLDNDPHQFDAFCEAAPTILLEIRDYEKFVTRTKLLNKLGFDRSDTLRANYDSFQASDLRKAFFAVMMKGDDKEFLQVYRRIRIALEEDRNDPKVHRSIIDQAFIDRVIPKAKHPLAGESLSISSITKFLSSTAYRVWSKDPLTEQAIDKLILDKLSGPHIAAPREDWVKANFSKGLPTIAAQQIKDRIDSLITADKIRLTNPNNPSKSGLQLVR